MNRHVLACAAMFVVASVNGCSQEEDCPIDHTGCYDFQPGTDMSNDDFGGDVPIKGQLVAIAQACGNLSVVAGEAMRDVTGACRNIAIDLGSDPNDPKAQGKAGTDLLTFWCSDPNDGAVARLEMAYSALTPKGEPFTPTVTPATCDVPIAVAASCQAKCTPGGSCDLDAHPPTCEGGTLVRTSDGSTLVSCSGGRLRGGCDVDLPCQANCNAAAQASATCTAATVTIPPSTDADPTRATLSATLTKNLPLLLAVSRGRGQPLLDDLGDVSNGFSSIGASKKLDVVSTLCVTDMIAAEISANQDFKAAFDAANAVSKITIGN
ncbi:MAG TPA: hypothetical protein VF407_07505 [Polyangiaceae bacterium]